MARVIGRPNLKSNAGNVCAFCHYWGSNPQLERYQIWQVLYDGHVVAKCLKRGSQFGANKPACNEFEMSNDASRYCQR